MHPIGPILFYFLSLVFPNVFSMYTQMYGIGGIIGLCLRMWGGEKKKNPTYVTN